MFLGTSDVTFNTELIQNSFIPEARAKKGPRDRPLSGLFRDAYLHEIRIALLKTVAVDVNAVNSMHAIEEYFLQL